MAGTAKKAAAAPPVEPVGDPGAFVEAPEVTPSSTSGGGKTFAVSVGDLEGKVTFTRPGVESHTYDVKGGVITTTKDRAEWLVRYTGANPVPDEKE